MEELGVAETDYVDVLIGGGVVVVGRRGGWFDAVAVHVG